MAQICINSKGIKVVEIDKIKFKGKRKIDWRSVGVKNPFRHYPSGGHVIVRRPMLRLDKK